MFIFGDDIRETRKPDNILNNFSTNQIPVMVWLQTKPRKPNQNQRIVKQF